MRAVVQAQPDPITNCKGNRPVLTIILPLCLLLGLLQTHTDILQELITLSQILGNGHHSDFAGIIGVKRRRVAAINHTEGSCL
jgi:hypothetical protein